VRLNPLCRLPAIWPVVPALDGAFGKMNGRVNWSTRRKPAPVPLCPPQIPYDLSWARTQTAAVGSQQLTTWATAWPYIWYLVFLVLSSTNCDCILCIYSIAKAMYLLSSVLRQWNIIHVRYLLCFVLVCWYVLEKVVYCM
jgi:hypothetical protein